MKVRYSFDLIFIKRFFYLCGKLTGSSLLTSLLITLLLLKLIEEFLIYNVGIITSGYYKVIGDRDLDAFYRQSFKSLGLIAAISLLLSARQYVSSIFYISSRDHLTSQFHRSYFRNNNFYEINDKNTTIDNPDQRITQDVEKFGRILGSILPTLIVSPFTIAYYTYSSYITTGWVGPVSVLVYFLVGTLVNKFLMSSVVALVYLQEKLEGHFRFRHMHVRTNAESVAFQNGSTVECKNVDRNLSDLIKAQEKQTLLRLPLDVSVNIFNYFGSILSFLVLAVPVFSGVYDSLSSSDLSALLSKNTFVTIYLISCCSNLVNLSDDLATLAGLTHRVAQLSELLDETSKTSHDNYGADDETTEIDSSSLLVVQDLTYGCTNEDTPLVQNLNLTVSKESGNVLIFGGSGVGKTTFFRVLKDLWTPVSGHFKFNLQESEVMFMPQKPILLLHGSLRKQIVYPHSDSEESDRDQEIMGYLSLAGLNSLVQRIGRDDWCLDVDPGWNWTNSLSPGEAQCLCFLRLFYHKPKMAFLDESLAAVSHQMEDILYRQCTAMGITLVSIGHRESLREHHKTLLTLKGHGKWSLGETQQLQKSLLD